MPLLKILVVSYFAVSCFDAWLTNARMHRYGIDVELTSTIRKLAKAVNIETAIVAGILVPSAAMCALCLIFRTPTLMGLLLGFRLNFFYVQLQSLIFEAQLKKFKREHPDVFGGQSSETRSPLQRDPLQSGDSTTAPLDSNGEEKHG